MYSTAIILAGLVLLASCATAPPQTTDAVLADLAPTGKLRVGINYGNPVFTTKGSTTGEGFFSVHPYALRATTNI